MQRTSLLALAIGLACVSCGAPKNGPASSASPETTSDAPSADASSPTPSAHAPSDGASAAKSDDGWKTFTYAPGVTVDMPGKPADAGVGGVFALKRGEGRGLSVQCMDGGGSKKDTTDMLAGMRRGVLGERKLLSEKKITRGDATGTRLDIATETTAGTTKMHVLLLAGQRHLCNFTSIVSGSAPDADTDRFLESAKVD